MNRRRSRLLSALAALFLMLVLGAGVLYAMLAGSLPRRGGEVALAGLAGPVAVELDARAIARIRAASLTDALRAQGFVHAQERYFQMDLTRRRAAGELAALFGPRALELDRAQRPFELRARSRELASRLPRHQREWLAAYVEGVNAGLDDLGARPFEYWLLGRKPAPWMLEDTLLVVYSLYTTLSQHHAFERPQAVMRETLAPAVYELLTPSTSRFDRPLGAPPDDPTGGYSAAPIPGSGVIDLRRERSPAPGPIRVDPPADGTAASNGWAVGGARSAHGGAILANDPHLDLTLPGTFHRAELHWPGRVARGVGIPGAPGILLGATDRLAFGATASYADQSDWVVVELAPDDAGRYRVPGGYARLGFRGAEIEVAGRDAPEHVRFRTTRWGPIVAEDRHGRPLALNATWLHPDGASLDVLELLEADDLEQGLDVLSRWDGPSLSWLVTDTEGRAAWIMNGPLPARHGHDGVVPVSWADGTAGWTGLLEPPRGLTADDVLFTANNRPLPRAAAARIGRGWIRPLRAHRIAELLAAEPRLDETAFLEMQLDTRAAGYDLLRDLVLEVTDASETDPALAAARRSVAGWNGRADAHEAGFRILQAFYLRLLDRVLTPLLMPAIEADPAFVYRWPLADEPLRRLLETRPAHLLVGDYATWPDFLRDVLDETLARLAADPARAGLDASWGEINRLDVAHPLAELPVVGRRLRLPPAPQPGSTVSVRVASPRRGAVVRMAVSPDRPEHGYLQMLGGQSGHPLSRHFDDLHTDWRDGVATPFVAGPTEEAFRLVPAEAP